MKDIQLIFLILWILIFLDSLSAVICKNIKSCVKSSFVQYFLEKKNVPFDNNWPYIYLFLGILGLTSVIILNRTCL